MPGAWPDRSDTRSAALFLPQYVRPFPGGVVCSSIPAKKKPAVAETEAGQSREETERDCPALMPRSRDLGIRKSRPPSASAPAQCSGSRLRYRRSNHQKETSSPLALSATFGSRGRTFPAARIDRPGEDGQSFGSRRRVDGGHARSPIAALSQILVDSFDPLSPTEDLTNVVVAYFEFRSGAALRHRCWWWKCVHGPCWQVC